MFPEALVQPQAIDVHEVWELMRDRFGHRTAVVDLPDNVEGRTWPDGLVELSEKTYIRLCRNDGRARFTTMHECFHAWQHSHQIKERLDSTNKLVLQRSTDIPWTQNPEWQANNLASAFLMPLEAVRILRSNGRVLRPELLVDVFQVSYTAAKIRLEVLKTLGAI